MRNVFSHTRAAFTVARIFAVYPFYINVAKPLDLVGLRLFTLIVTACFTCVVGLVLRFSTLSTQPIHAFFIKSLICTVFLTSVSSLLLMCRYANLIASILNGTHHVDQVLKRNKLTYRYRQSSFTVVIRRIVVFGSPTIILHIAYATGRTIVIDQWGSRFIVDQLFMQCLAIMTLAVCLSQMLADHVQHFTKSLATATRLKQGASSLIALVQCFNWVTRLYERLNVAFSLVFLFNLGAFLFSITFETYWLIIRTLREGFALETALYLFRYEVRVVFLIGHFVSVVHPFHQFPEKVLVGKYCQGLDINCEDQFTVMQLFDKKRFYAYFNAKDFFSAFALLNFFSKIFGILPYCKSKVWNTIFDAYTITMFVATILSSYYSFTMMDFDGSDRYVNSINFYSEKMTVFFTSFCYIVSTVCFLRRKKKLQACFEYVDVIDKQIADTGHPFVYNSLNHNWMTLSLVSLVFLDWLVDIFLYTVGYTAYGNLQMVSYYFPFIVIQLVTAQWYALVKLVGDHFVHLATLIDQSSLSSSTNKLVYFLRIHLNLKKTCSKLNSIFNAHLFCTSAYVFLFITLNAFVAARIVLVYRTTFNTIIAMFVFIFVKFHALIVIVSASVRTTNEAKAFSAALYRLMINDKTGALASNEKLQLHIMYKNEIQFTACGFFKVDYTLVHSMVASATTYLAILLQFEIHQKWADYAQNWSKNETVTSTVKPPGV